MFYKIGPWSEVAGSDPHLHYRSNNYSCKKFYSVGLNRLHAVALLTNIRLGWKGSAVAYTLAYSNAEKVTLVKSFTVQLA